MYIPPSFKLELCQLLSKHKSDLNYIVPESELAEILISKLIDIHNKSQDNIAYLDLIEDDDDCE